MPETIANESSETLPVNWLSPDALPFGLLWLMAGFLLCFEFRYRLDHEEFVTEEVGMLKEAM